MSILRVDNIQTTDGNKTVPVKDLLSTSDSNISATASPGNILKFGDTSGIPTVSIKDDVNQRLYLNKSVSNPNDLTVLQISRDANYEGGSSGFVGSALLVRTTSKSKSTIANFEWAGLFILDNFIENNPNGGGPGGGAVPQQVALYGQANKNSTSATWAGCLEINDNNGTSANGAAIGLEITVRSTGADTATISRVGMHVAAHTPDSSNAAEWGTAYFATSDSSKNVRFRHALRVEGIIGDSLIYNAATTNQANAALIRDAGSLSIGIELSSASYSSGTAIRVKLGDKISFDGQDANYLYGSATAGIVSNSLFTMRNSFQVTSSTGTISAGSSFTTTSDGYLIFKVDGVQKKIPYFNV